MHWHVKGKHLDPAGRWWGSTLVSSESVLRLKLQVWQAVMGNVLQNRAQEEEQHLSLQERASEKGEHSQKESKVTKKTPQK